MLARWVLLLTSYYPHWKVIEMDTFWFEWIPYPIKNLAADRYTL